MVRTPALDTPVAQIQRTFSPRLAQEVVPRPSRSSIWS